MKELVVEINEKIKLIIEDLENRKLQAEEALNDIQNKIDSKIEEAKLYKTDVDLAKSEIARLEKEITSLEEDLQDLTERFSNKDLNAILETGNKEINAQIVLRQKDIAKQREKIAEFTEKARTIKDLLINLKKDKENKKVKLDDITTTYEYYNNELTKIINYSTENYDNLIEYTSEDTEEEPKTYEFNNEPIVDDKVVFDAIESIEKDDESEEATSLEEEKQEEPEVNVFNEEPKYTDDIFSSLDALESKAINNNDEKTDKPNENIDLFRENEIEEPVHEEDLYHEDNITNLFNEDSNDSFDSFDFKALNDSIDREYENIFGNSEDIELTDEENNFQNNDLANEQALEKNVQVDEPQEEFNFFGNTEPVENIFNSIENQNPNEEITNFFRNNNIDFNNFKAEDQKLLEENFNIITYTKTLDILRKNNIKLENIYNAASIFEINHNELENIISKLLLAGQSTQNISYVLNTFQYIKAIDLQDVIDSYGVNIKDANITDLIIKAKHLNDLGGGNL